MTTDLVCRALNMAIKNKRPNQQLIVHYDRGSQYCSHAYYKIIKQHKLASRVRSTAPQGRMSWCITKTIKQDSKPSVILLNISN